MGACLISLLAWFGPSQDTRGAELNFNTEFQH